ncbi:flagellar basal body P-ring protein FlgI [Piscinibacter terrae]|uniref:Flagellar P-ring protein n=1 Tax=Piscinibacter terrae TaxID=2496871 RepID=A0A3N7HWA3_9BURK|nr:flagellar basal body P-ring protein FlgI [Albitalea terrae]RQP26658.1 flagellar basal body P-ring protein FlgI [Albitalea terrae]
MRSRLTLAFVLAALLGASLPAVAAAAASTDAPVRIKDLGRLSGWRENALVGYGLVTGLAGTGDSARSKATRQSIANMLSRFDVAIPSDDVNTRNVAAVMVTAQLPAFARTGDTIDVTVTSVGDARSLVGGTLLLAPMKGANGHVYALAQGSVSVGGYRYDANGTLTQKNHPTVGTVSAGATVEATAPDTAGPQRSVTFVLAQPDYTTAARIADAINQQLGQSIAEVRDAGGVDVAVPEKFAGQVPRFLATLESVSVQPDRRAKVVVNERTGTVVSGGDVRISRVAVSHGELRVSVVTENSVSQPTLVRQTGPGVRTQEVANSRISVDENAGSVFLPPTNNTVADLVQALARLHTPARDVISILEAVKAAGALHADLIVQ